MKWMPGAHVRDLSQHGIGNGPFKHGRFLGVVLHVNVDEHGTPDSFWGDGNRGQVCPNFEVFKDGSIHQFLPFDWQPWCQIEGNFRFAAIETAGLPSEKLTPAQVASIAKILDVYHEMFGMRMHQSNHPTTAGFGTHQMGGASWGGHSCPGQVRADQRDEILKLTKARQTENRPKPPETSTHPITLTDIIAQMRTLELRMQEFEKGHAK